MWWASQIIALQSRLSPLRRWLVALTLFGIALAVRLAVGTLYGGMPSLAFYPVLLIVAVICGWKEATAVLIMSATVAMYLFLPPGMYLQPVGWILVGGLTIATIDALKTLARQLAIANERQRLLFRELQHRVANTLHSVVGTLELAERRIETNPAEAKRILREQVARVLSSAEVHRRLNDPSLFAKGLKPILYDAVTAIIDPRSVRLSVDVDPLGLSYDQMTAITMIVIEMANNAQKHVFGRHLGTELMIAVRGLPQNGAVLSVKDDGPGWSPTDAGQNDGTLGLGILQDWADQLRGKLTISVNNGTQISLVFPISKAH
jgi:two-component sensor histidine kinase